MKVLIIDDEKILSQSIARNLEQHGYHADVAHSFREYKKNDPLKYSIFIIDISLWDGNGLDIIHEIRTELRLQVPILIISWHESTSLKIKWLDIWADDYITKPFSPDELMARIRSIMRREWQSWDAGNVIRYKDITFDLWSREIKKWWKTINFTKKEKQIVEFFLFRKKELISKRQLIQSLRHTKDLDYVTDNTINVTIYKVRKKLWDGFHLETRIWEWYILKD